MSQFPQERVERIMGHLANDKSSLAACTLVCHAWLLPARRHLFHAVIVAQYNLATIKALLPALTDALYTLIRRINLYDTPWGSGHYSDLLSVLHIIAERSRAPALYIGQADTPLLTTLAAAGRRFVHVTDLRLGADTIRNTADYIRVACAFPQVRELYIVGEAMQASDTEGLALPAHVSTLTLNIESRVIPWLIAQNLVAVHTLYLYRLTTGILPTSDVQRLLYALGPSLTQLSIQSDFEHALDLKTNERLAQLSLHFLADTWYHTPHGADSDTLTSTLKTVAPELATVVLDFSNTPHRLYAELGRALNSALDAALLHCPVVRAVCKRWCPLDEFEATLCAGLPACAARGNLVFETAPAETDERVSV